MVEENLTKISLIPSRYQTGVVRYIGGQTTKYLENNIKAVKDIVKVTTHI